MQSQKFSNSKKEPEVQSPSLDFSLAESNQASKYSLLGIQQSVLKQATIVDFYSSPEMSSNSQNQSKLSDEDRTYKSQKKQEKQSQSSARPLCCRTFFYQNQIIAKSELSIFFPSKPVYNHSQIEENNIYLGINSTLQFESASFPFPNSALIRFERAICSFLNGIGGTIFIGISSNPNEYKVDGLQINEGDKEVILKNFRVIGSKIQPDIMTHKLYSVEFVPLKNRNSNSFIPCAFIIKVKVKYGNRNETYCIKDKDSFYDEFVFRSNDGSNSIIEGRRLLDIVKDRFYNPLPVPELLHPGPCQKPDIGFLGYESCNDNQDKIGNGYNSKKNDRNQTNNKQKTQTHSKIRQETQQNVSSNLIIKEPSKRTTTAHNQKINTEVKQETLKKSSLMQVKKEPSPAVEAYYYVVGLTLQQLQPVLMKKNICNAIIEQAQQHLKLIVKAFDEETISKMRKLLKRIQSKYGNDNIHYHELSLKVRVLKFQEAMTQLKKLSCMYETDERNSVFKFYSFKESLRSWLYLKGCGIQGHFVK